MDSSKDIYHKADTSIPPRRKGRTTGEAYVRDPALPPPVNPTAIGTQHIGAPISPVQIARQQMQMNPGQHVRRRRRRHRDSDQRGRNNNRLVWILVGLIVVSYLAILARKLWVNWKNPPVANPPTKVQNAGTKPKPAQPAPSADGGLPASERVQRWGKGLRAMDDARQLMNSGRMQLAKDKLKIAAESLPNATEQLFGTAKISFTERDYPAAERLLLRVVDAEPSNAEARELLARALFENAHYVDALAVAEWICSLDPYSESAHDTAATSALTPQINDPNKAIEHLKKLATLRSDDLTIKNNLGKAYLRVGDIAGARRIYEEMLKADDLNSAAHYNLAICQVKQNKPDEAIATLSRAANKLDINFVATWLNSSDFTPLHTQPDFIALQRRLGSGTTVVTPTPAPPVEK